MSQEKIIENPISYRCAEILAQREHVLLGVSACVGYYTIETITKLIKWANSNFKDFHVCLTGKKLLFANFSSLGHKNARRKALKHANNIFNKVKSAFSLIDKSINASEKTIIIEDVLENKKYIEIYESILEKYNCDQLFRGNCRETTRATLSTKLEDVTEEVIDIAVNYLLWELPFYINSPKILSVNSSLVVYHKDVKFFTDLYKNREDRFVADNQGHLIVEF